MQTVTDKYIVGTKGRDSKYSSKVYIVELVERESNELDNWFGPVDQVKTIKEYRSKNYDY